MTYFLAFFIFSFFGWVLEIIFAFLRTKEIQNRKTMKFLPLCPVYGIAATMLLFISKLIPKNIILYFIIGVLICSFVEYFFNEFFKISFKIKLWDYSTSKYNLNGNITLNFSLIWGLFSMILMSFADEIISFLIFFPSTITFFLLFLFTIDFFESMYLFKKRDIAYVQSYCSVMTENEKS